MINSSDIKLFRSLFHGRNDAFAIRWQKGDKSGYMPAYQFDPYHYRIHKAKGGTLANYQDKTLQPLTDDQVKRHLLGEQLIRSNGRQAFIDKPRENFSRILHDYTDVKKGFIL